MGSSGGAAVGVIAELVNVHATLRMRIVTADVPSDSRRGGLRLLLEGDGTGNFRVTSDRSNYKWRITRQLWSEWDEVMIRRHTAMPKELLARMGLIL